MAEPKCEFAFQNQGTTLEWTAFKYTERTAVKGKIESFSTSRATKARTILDSVRLLEFSVDPLSVNSGVPDRDYKIKTLFMGSATKKGNITGKVLQIGSDLTGQASMELNWNGLRKKIPVTYTVKDDVLEVNGVFSVFDFGFDSGLEKLNEACIELHKGTDGKSKLWPDVEFRIVSTFAKSCSS